jgi:RNA polymerase sigma-70 factor (ECF subfamily)
VRGRPCGSPSSARKLYGLVVLVDFREPRWLENVTSPIVTDAASERHSGSHARAQPGGRVLIFPEVSFAEVDDASIARLLLEGDSRAPRVTWDRFAPMVHRMLKRAFGPGHEIDDFAQEVFLTLFRRVHTLREPQALRAFVISITAHTIRYELRRIVARRWLYLGEPVEVQAADADLDSREAIARLYRLLGRLGSEDRTVFVLRFMEGLELTEVSEALGVSLATTKRRVARSWRRVAAGVRHDEALIGYLSGCDAGAAS